jgi:hypothetical protein
VDFVSGLPSQPHGVVRLSDPQRDSVLTGRGRGDCRGEEDEEEDHEEASVQPWE